MNLAVTVILRRNLRTFLSFAGVLLALGLFLFLNVRSSAKDPGPSPTQSLSTIQTESISAAYAKLPLSFEENVGQIDERVRFTANGEGYQLFLTASEAVLALRQSDSKDNHEPAGYRVVRMRLLDANENTKTSGIEMLPGKLNYFVGNDREKWRTDVPLFKKVQYQKIYDGIDLVYYGNQRELEYDFQVTPNTDPGKIRLQFEGTDKVSVDKDGSLVLTVDGREVRWQKPVIHQSDDGVRREIPGGYLVKSNIVTFRVGDYDRTKSLIIDPILSYATYLGASSNEIGWGIAVDSTGAAYITGETSSFSFPTTGTVFIPSDNSTGHAFVTKLDPTGSSLVYSTLVGGTAADNAFGISVDSLGSAYITGRTSSTNFPTLNPVRSSSNVLKSTDSGGVWLPSNQGLGTFAVSDIVINPSSPTTLYTATSGGVGVYKSTDGGATWTPTNTGFTGAGGAALAIDPQNTATIYAAVNSPFFGAIKSINGGNSWTQINTGLSGGLMQAIAVDPQTPSTIYAGTFGGIFKSTNGGANWQASNTGLTFSLVSSIAIDPTNSSTIYVSASSGGVFKSTNAGANWTQMNSGLTNTTVGALAIDPSNTAIIYAGTAGGGVFKSVNSASSWNPVSTGFTNLTVASLAIETGAPSTLYAGTAGTGIFKTTNGGGNWVRIYRGLTSPSVEVLTVGPAGTIYAGVDTRPSGSNNDSEAFVTKLNPAGNALVFSTYLGGSGADEGDGISVDGNGNVVVVGQTSSTDFLLANPGQSTFKGATDGFVTKFTTSGSGLVYSTYLGGTQGDIARGVAVDSTGNAYVTGNTGSSDFPFTPGSFQTSLSAGDAFVTKLDAAGNAFLYSTFLGGSGNEIGYGIAVDASGNAYVSGSTDSPNFPTVNAFQPNRNGTNTDAFVTKLNATGTGLVYSTYIGGSQQDHSRAIAIDSQGSAFITGISSSPDYPVSAGPIRNRSGFYKSTNAGGLWLNDNFGAPSTLGDLAINPVNTEVLYVASQTGIYRSQNGGRNWSAVNSGLTNLNVRVVEIDPQNPSTLYAGAASGGIGLFKSVNGGDTWASANGNQSFTDVSFVAVDPLTSGTVYISTGFSSYKTTNGGTIWNQIPSNQLPSFVSSFAINRQNPQEVYASINSSGGGVFKSTDGGATWIAVNNGLTATFVGNVTIDPTNGSTLYASTNLGMHKTTNGGATWSLLNSLGGSVVVDPVNPSVLYTSSFNINGTSVLKSTNGGVTFVPSGNGIPANAGAGVIGVDPLNTSTVYALSTPASDDDAFVTKLSPSGSNLIYSTTIGADWGFGIAVDNNSNAYVTGLARPGNLQTTTDAFQPINRGFDDAFVAKIGNSFSISGVVTNGSTPQSGVKLTLTGTSTGSFTTASDGTYQFANLVPGGTFTVSATKSGFSATPPSQTFSNISANQPANFTIAPSATPFHTISGQIIVLESGDPLVGANVALTGSQTEFTTTDSNGNYSFSAPDGGNYTVTPTLLGFTVVPPSNTVNNLNTNTTLNFQSLRVDFVVTNSNDHGAGSLRQAIINANVTFGPDRISFNIPGSGVKTISPGVPLPAITDPVTIDGTTQPGFAGSPLIELNGEADALASHGLLITSGNSTVRGLAINRFFAAGISLQTNGNNKIEGNIIGLDPSGTIARANRGGGISVTSGSNANIIGGTTVSKRNIISGNQSDGVFLSTAGNFIKGNYIGTNAAGTVALGNTGHGIDIAGFGQPNTTNQIGGTEVGAGNLISGNFNLGVGAAAPSTVIQGNLIGTDATGTQKVGNGVGISISGANCILGGTAPGARNIISGNGTGVSLNFLSNPMTFKGNFIGTDISGTRKLGNVEGVSVLGDITVGGLENGAGNLISGNDQVGIAISGVTSGFKLQGNLIGTDVSGQKPLGNATGISVRGSLFTIGGSQAGAGNVISGNEVGIEFLVNPAGNIVQGNLIGLTADGSGPMGNSVVGVLMAGAFQTQLGGNLPGEGNTIAFNGSGVAVPEFNATSNRISGNRIFSNDGLGIDLNQDGLVNPNDTSDSDTGANNLQNFPVITSVSSNGGSTNIKGSLNSTSSTQFRINFYSNAACDPSGNGEGALPFGNTQVTTNASGDATFDVTIPSSLPANRTITATATDPNGNTSEFSACDATNTRGSLEFIAKNVNVLEDVGNAIVRVVRTGGSKGSLSVTYTTTGGTATPGSDFTPVSGVLTFANGETEKLILLPIANDGVTEPEETVELTLSGVPDLEALGSKYQTVIHILDATTPLSLFVDAQAFDGYPEGNVGNKTVNIPVHLSAQTSRTVSVSYSVTAVSATANVDFVPTSGSLTFNPGSDTQNVPVQFIGDTLDENTETFLLTLSNAVNASIATPTTFVPIIDDDPLAQLTVTDVAVLEGAGAKAVFSIALNVPSGRSLQVNFSTANGTATAGTDYTFTAGTLVFAAGETLKQVEVPVLTDGTAEPDETFFLNLTNPLRVAITDGQGLGTIVDASSSTSVFQFSAPSYTANEDGGQIQITVNRLGGTTGTATVDYQTVSGSASDRTDYTTAIGTLRFDAGVTSQAFNVLLTDDTFAEPTESANLVLSNPTGGLLGGPTTVPFNIISNDITDTGSPVREASFNTAFFVRQHYHDFLNREPDAAGLAFWMNQIDSCGDAQCRELKKINVSGAFFLSIEFQETGYLVYRNYKASFGDTTSPNVSVPVPIIRFNEFLPDSQRIGLGVQVGIGSWEQQLENNKVAYFQEFVQRQRFLGAFPLSMTPAQFVDKLNQNSGGVLSPSERDQLIAELNAAPTVTQGRASVLRKVADDSDMKNNERNRAFVLMQYFGYLRRNPDDPQDTDFRGWEFWLNKLNQFNGNFIDAEMVKAFITSGEYSDRFGR